jgi:hypothetical protein
MITPQEEFAAALLDPDAAPPRDLRAPAGGNPARRFAIYRNNVASALIDALATRFPVVVRLVGAEFFNAMAGIYVRQEPPRSPLMFLYGDSFPAFVERFGPAAPLPYLADVARLEWARGAAYHAADVEPLDPEALARLPPARLASCALRVHPSLGLIASPFPIVTIWRAHQGDQAVAEPEWGREDALIARPELEVEVHRLPIGGFGFFTALAGGSGILAAAETAAVHEHRFHAVENLALLLKARIAVGIVAAGS